MLKHGLRLFPKADGHSVVRIHKTNTDRQIDQLLLAKYGTCGLIIHFRYCGLRHACNSLSPCERGPLAFIEQNFRLTPDLHQRQLLDFHTLLLKDAAMLIQAIGAAVDLGYAPINNLQKHVREARLQDIAIYSPEGFHACRRTFCVVDTYAHERVSLSIGGGEFFICRVDNKHGKQLGWLGGAYISSQNMMRARGLEEALAGPVSMRRLTLDLTFNRARYDVGIDERRLRMTMWTRRAARRIIHLDGNQRFPGKIGNGMREVRCDGFMNIISYRGRREHESGRDHQWIDFHLHRVSFTLKRFASGLLLGHVDDPGLGIFRQASVAQFGSDAGLLVAPEGNVGLQVEMPVDPDRARIDLRGDGEGPLGILRPDAAAEPELRIVRARDGVFDLGIAQHRQNWAELLLPDQSRIVADVANNRRFDEIALALQNIAARNDNAVLFGILQEALHPLEMRLILQRPDLRSRLGAFIDDSLAGQPPEFLAEFVILRIMNVEALDHDAALAGIEGRAGEQLGRYFLWIDVVEHNGGVVAAELQREALQRAGRAFHDFPAGRSRARECDFGDVRMAGERLPKIVGVDNDVDHPRGQNIGAQLTQSKRRQRGRRRRLGDNGVAGKQRRRDLRGQQDHWHVPRRYRSDHA